MASPLSWPAWMFHPLQSGFSMQPEDRRIAQSTTGTSFQKGFGGDVCTADVSVTLNRVQSAWLEQFERDVSVQGTVWFDFPLWYCGEVSFEQCRFKTRPKISGVNGLYATYSFSLYVRKRTNIMPDCLAKILLCWPPCFFFSYNSLLGDIYKFLSNTTNDAVSSALSGLYEE